MGLLLLKTFIGEQETLPNNPFKAGIPYWERWDWERRNRYGIKKEMRQVI